MRVKDDSISKIIRNGMRAYHEVIKLNLMSAMEDLYNTEDDDKCPAQGEMFNKAIAKCVDIVKKS